MIVFPNAKINIGLNIIEKRNDGFHNLVSCFYPIDWKDILEIVPSKQTTFSSSGLSIPGDSTSNLCLKAYYLLRQDFDIPEVSIHLHKVIPIGAGLGGGSSDAAFTIKLLNDIFQLNLSIQQMEDYARKLGSDCAFFIRNKPLLAYGKGDKFKELALDLSNKKIVLINPNIHISTKEAYSGISPNTIKFSHMKLLNEINFDEWRENLVNDFENHLFESYPVMASIKSQLYDLGAVYASMSGSGSTVYGIFENLPSLSFFEKKYLVKTTNLDVF